MLNYISQDERASKHVSFLRRIFLQKMTGILYIHFSEAETYTLEFHTGDLVGHAKSFTPVLQRFLTGYVKKFAWKTCEIDAKYGWVAPWIALSDALRGAEIEAGRLITYQHAFSKLPPMILKNCPVHRFNFADESSYLFLYHLSLDMPSFKSALFFQGNISKTDLAKRVRTMLLVFLLGYLKPVPKEVKEKSKSSIASRILNRFRAKGA